VQSGIDIKLAPAVGEVIFFGQEFFRFIQRGEADDAGEGIVWEGIRCAGQEEERD
jgi:hypothetical protein